MNIKSIFIAAVALLASTACSGGAKQEKVMAKDGKALVVFFSHAGDNYAVGNIEVGNTKIVADYITDLTGAEQFEIVTHKYDGMAYNPLIKLAQEEARNGELPEVRYGVHWWTCMVGNLSASDVHLLQETRQRLEG